MNKTPAILALAGLDPGGGAGLTADIQTITAYGVHPLAVATAITAQSTQTVTQVVAVDADLIAAQVNTALADWSVVAVKVGLIPDLNVLTCVAALLEQLDAPHVVIDPVFIASSGDPLSQPESQAALLDLLLPMRPVLTPNRQELDRLTAASTRGAESLLARGARAVLVTDGEGSTTHCMHQLAMPGMPLHTIRQERLKGRFHGSGCTLSTALAAELASGKDLTAAAHGALNYTHATLRKALGCGAIKIPNRRN